MKSIIILPLVFLLSSLSFAKKDECANTYNIATTNVWPVSFRDKDGRMVGVGIDLSRGISAHTGCRIVINSIPPYKNWQSLKDDKTDLALLNIEDSGEYGNYGHFIPVVKSRRVLVVNPKVYNKEWKIQDYVAAPHIRFSGIIAMKYAYHKDEVESLRKQHLYLETTDNENLLSLLRKGSADATFFPQAVFEYFKKNTKIAEGLMSIPDKVSWLSSGIYASKARIKDGDLKRIQSAVTEMAISGETKAMFEKYEIDQNSIEIIGSRK